MVLGFQMSCNRSYTTLRSSVHLDRRSVYVEEPDVESLILIVHLPEFMIIYLPEPRGPFGGRQAQM